MKIATVIVRVLMGALFLFASVAYFLKLFPTPELTGAMKSFNDGLTAAGYFLPLLMTVELVCGLAFVTGRFVPLASVLIAPVIVNIFFVHLTLDRSGLPVAVFLVAANLFLAWRNREAYRGLLKP